MFFEEGRSRGPGGSAATTEHSEAPVFILQGAGRRCRQRKSFGHQSRRSCPGRLGPQYCIMGVAKRTPMECSTMRTSFAVALSACFLVSPLAAQDRMPPIPADKLTDAQKKAADEFAEG